LSQLRSGASGLSQGSSPVRDKDFWVRMRHPNYLGLVTLTSFGWDDKPRFSMCTHSEHQARTIKILQSLCVSPGVEITTRQLAKCEWNLDLASNSFNLLASLASALFLLSVSLFSPLIESYSSSIPKYKRRSDMVIYLLLWHTHTVMMVYFFG
jgi:hypothetical protein